MIITNEEILKNVDEATKKEWLIANGLGGYASSTIIGLNTRKYHGLLVAALGKSGERFLVLSKINETIIDGKGEYTISSNECPNYIEKGYKYQKCFAKELLPEFFYSVNDTEIIKKISMCHGENKVAITYTVKSGERDIRLRLAPLVNFRGFHSTKDFFKALQVSENNVQRIELNSKHNLYMTVSEGEYNVYPNTYYQNMYYKEEVARGLEHIESHFMPGYYEIEIPKNEEKVIEFVASVDDKMGFFMKPNAMSIIRSEETRLQKYIKMSGLQTDIDKQLVVASDSFIVDRNYGKTIIAGYHWFGDWGRDTFIALEGLLLKTNRFNDAKQIIISFSKYIKNGLVPNLIGEDGGEAYNSVDASLWYIYAIYKYYKYTDDVELIKIIYPKIIEIIKSYKEGTLYKIKMDEDYLITAGDETTQLTWMDARIGDYIPTSRHGKAVEVNSLWYNALNIAFRFSQILGEEFDYEIIPKVKKSFEKFYLGNGLADTINPENDDIRPNQIFAVSLEFQIVDNQKANEIIDIIEEELLTPKGLKTLNKSNPKYKGKYRGGVLERDSSYHQGTVWPWLLLGYHIACYKMRRKPKIELDLNNLLDEYCLGSIAEIYDGDEPQMPNGAISQAWSVAMALIV